MKNKKVIKTNNAPAAIGTYSQAIAISQGKTIYLSGQIPLVPSTMEIIGKNIEDQIRQVFENLKSVCSASGGNVNDIVKLNVFLTDLSNFSKVNEIMAEYFDEPYPARAAIGINELPKAALVEMDAIMVVS